MADKKTPENLYAAFVGEAKASLRLLGFAEQAEREGYAQMARLFRAISRAEQVHALRHLRQLQVVKDTESNLKAAFASETAVSENYYPEFIKVAEAEGEKAAVLGFSHARDAETYHAKLYKNAIEHMVAETESDYFVCSVCGYVTDAAPPDECPVCGAGPEQFVKVD